MAANLENSAVATRLEKVSFPISTQKGQCQRIFKLLYIPILNPAPTSPHRPPYHLSGSSPCTSPKHPVSYIEHRLALRFSHDSIHVSMPFSQIIPPSPAPSESKSPFYTSVSLLLSRIQGHHYHLSKFHIYVSAYCIGVFLSGLLHSV